MHELCAGKMKNGLSFGASTEEESEEAGLNTGLRPYNSFSYEPAMMEKDITEREEKEESAPQNPGSRSSSTSTSRSSDGGMVKSTNDWRYLLKECTDGCVMTGGSLPVNRVTLYRSGAHCQSTTIDHRKERTLVLT